nr:uncharacterized protein LOC106685132 [Halyomorpha halys]
MARKYLYLDAKGKGTICTLSVSVHQPCRMDCNMEPFELSGYKLRVLWNGATGLEAYYCQYEKVFCREGIQIERTEFLHSEKICDRETEIYLLFRHLIRKCQKPTTACGVVVTWTISHHRYNTFQQRICDGGYNHNILYTAVRLAEEFNVENDALLMELLKNIYKCERSFESLFSGVLNTSYIHLLE